MFQGICVPILAPNFLLLRPYSKNKLQLSLILVELVILYQLKDGLQQDLFIAGNESEKWRLLAGDVMSAGRLLYYYGRGSLESAAFAAQSTFYYYQRKYLKSEL